jgi:hypothetical protein
LRQSIVFDSGLPIGWLAKTNFIATTHSTLRSECPNSAVRSSDFAMKAIGDAVRGFDLAM